MIAEFFATLAIHFDLPILDWIAAHLHCGFLDWFMPIVTLLGDAGIFWIACAVVLIFIPKYRKAGLSMGLALLMGLVVCNLTMKPLFARIRPYDFQLEHYGKVIPLIIEAQHDFSFPSGHTIASFEASVVLLKNSKKMGIPAFILAILVSFSRLSLYVHYPTDVIVSVILGTIFAFIGDAIAQRIPLPQGKKGKYER